MVITNDKTLLEVTGLTTSFFTGEGTVHAVNDVAFTVGRGEIFGLVGESGSGKTVTAHSIMRLVHQPGRITGGRIVFEGRDLLGLNEKQMEEVRGSRIGMVFQEPMTALNPVLRIGEQISETLEIHRASGGNGIRQRVMELLNKVGFDDPEKRLIQYPHQLSGGQRQRVLMAMAIACGPSLVIADEPTTALDVATQSQILGLLEGLVDTLDMSMIFITHDLNIVRSLGHSIGLMYAGRMLELSRVENFFKQPLHPYGRGLLGSIGGFSGSARRLTAIPGSVPRLSELPTGCTFHPRCPYIMDMCRVKEPVMKEVEKDQWVRCYLYQN
ncbi:MAG TPA: ABC transporter ATP-binding protein [Syntrophorhabdaceae bacterium]|nr:ABC transporter ATP-binding protein [Syntrophorhabdaceae bacterium]